MTLESGPAKTDRIYWSIVTLAAVVFAAYFFYDGKWGYLKKNRAEAVKQLITLTGKSSDEIELGETPTQADFQALQPGGSLTAEQVRAALGSPIHTKRDSAGQTVEYFASVYGLATIPLKNDRVDTAAMLWTTWFKSKEEVGAQYIWGLIPLLFGIYTGRRAFRAVTLRVLIDDEGMTYAGQRIPFDAMTALRDYNAKGWVDLYYRSDAGEKRLRLDNQKVAKFEEIVEAVCQVKGFKSPVPPAASPDEDRAAAGGALTPDPADPDTAEDAERDEHP